MRAASFFLVPRESERIVRVRSGVGRGLLLQLNPRWETALWDGSYEQPVQELLGRLLKGGCILYDVGGGIGFHSLVAARLGATIFTFEPDALNARAIENHARLNNLSAPICLIRAAAFSYSGTITMEPAEQRTGHGNARVRNEGKNLANALDVPCVALDDFAGQNPAPDLIKIDVEGAESEVLKGSEWILRTHRPLLVCEVHDPANAAFIEHRLTQRGYEVHWLAGYDSYPKQLLASPRAYRREVAFGSPAPVR